MSFSVGGFSHWVVMVLTLTGALLMIRHRRAWPEGRTLDRWFALFLSLAWPGSVWQYWHFGTLTLNNVLPLHLCDIALFTSIYALLTRNQMAVELTWYFGLAGTSHGLLTPALHEEWPHPRFVTFFAQHAGVVVAALYLVLGHQQWPRPGSVRKAWLVAVGYCFVVGGVNVLLRTNYGFLCAKPPTASLMDHFGPWPWYNGVVLLLAGILFILLYQPVRWLRPAKKEDASMAGSAS